MALFLAVAAGSSAAFLHAAPTRRTTPHRGAVVRLQVGDFVDPDLVSGTFVVDELAATWARAGKGRQLWKPGDKTDSAALDYKLLYTTWKLNPLVLHGYEHCPFCTRARLVLGFVGMPFVCRFYGYGAGADPAKCEGFGYDPVEGGVVPLIGSKVCPVLSGAGVPVREGQLGLPESLEICSFAAGVAKDRRIAPATGRKDIDEWLNRVKPTREALERPRLLRMAVPDFADQRDVEYARWKHTRSGFDYDAAEKATPKLLAELAPLLDELGTMLRGRDPAHGSMPTLNLWGLSIDDSLVLPVLRSLTCVKGLEMPPLVREYVETGCARAGVPLFTEMAS